MGNANDAPWLHIRGQFTYHSEATIVGTKPGLIAIRAAIDQAINTGTGVVQVFATDGEGYDVEVRRSSTVAGLGKPTYADEEARNIAEHERAYLVRERKALRKQDKEALDALRWCRANGDPHKAPRP